MDNDQPLLKLGRLKRLLSIATISLAACCFGFLILFPTSFFLHLPEYDSDLKSIEPNASISFGSFHCVASRGQLWFYTREVPYCGSILGFEGLWDEVSVTTQQDWQWSNSGYGLLQESYIDQTGQSAGRARYGDFPGIYYRSFQWRSSKSIWSTLAISLWYPTGLSAILPSWWLARRIRVRLRLKLRTLLIAITVIAIFDGFSRGLHFLKKVCLLKLTAAPAQPEHSYLRPVACA